MARQEPIELFMPPNILKAKAGGSYHGLDMGAIRRAESAVEALRSEFRGWAQDDLNRLVAARDRYSRARSSEDRNSLMRAAYDLNCQAASFDFPLVARIAGSLSRLLDETSDSAELPSGLVDAHVDAAQVIFRENIIDDKNEIARLLCAELDARVRDALKKRPRTSSRKAN